MNLAALENNSEISLKDKFVYFLIFLFPIAGMSVRHWISAIFTFLSLLSFTYLHKKSHALAKEEKILLWILAAFFIAFMISALANGWTERQSKYLGVEIRYLLAVPLYLMIRQLPDAGKWILRGCVIGGIVLGIQAYYDIEILKWSRATGIYSPNLLGPYAVLIMFWSLIAFNIEDKSVLFRYFIPISVVCALYALLMSGSRGAYLGFTVLLIVWSISVFKWRQAILVIGSSIILIISVYNVSTNFSSRIYDVFNEVNGIINVNQNEINKESLGGIAVRIEMWKASVLLIKENPVLGIGRGNYEYLLPKYIEEGRVNKSIEAHGLGHPHNAYIEAFVSKGIVGFSVFMMMLLWPLMFFVKKYRFTSEVTLYGMGHLVGFMVFSISDASTFIKGNYVSIFLLFLVVFFSRSILLGCRRDDSGSYSDESCNPRGEERIF